MPGIPLIERLNQRKIVRWALAYALFAAGALGVLDAISDPLALSLRIQRVIIVFICAGFFVALLLAWYHGEKGAQRFSTREGVLLGAVLGLGCIAAWLVPSGAPEEGGRSVVSDLTSTQTARPAIAVLPLENLSPDPGDAYFADGVHQEIISKLSKVSGIRVSSRNSVLAYQQNRKLSRAVAEELGVDFLLEGSARIGGGAVRLSLSLVDGRSDETLWTEEYDRPFSVEEFIPVQSAIARQVALALRIEIAPHEEDLIARLPTENTEAYDQYLQGRMARGGPAGGNSLQAAEAFFAQAARLDPGFAEAHAALSEVRSWQYWAYYDRTQRRLALAQDAANRALQLDPDLPEAHWALGTLYYYGSRDYERALEEYDRARELGSPEAEYLVRTGYIKRRLGDFPAAVADLLRASQLDPGWSALHAQIGQTYFWAHRFPEADRYYREAVSLGGENLAHRARLSLAWKGDRASVRSLFSGEERSEVARQLLSRSVTGSLSLFRLVFPRPEEAEEVLVESRAGLDPARFHLSFAEVHGRLGNPQVERAHYDSARAALEDLLDQRPGDPAYLGELGVALAGSGSKELAMETGTRAVRLLPLELDAVDGPEPLIYLARVQAMTNDTAAAIETLGTLLRNPGWITVEWIRIDPVWETFHDHPAFRALLETGYLDPGG
jgi:TolB-like protein/Flp pilus assembly protein TadD